MFFLFGTCFESSCSLRNKMAKAEDEKTGKMCIRDRYNVPVTQSAAVAVSQLTDPWTHSH